MLLGASVGPGEERRVLPHVLGVDCWCRPRRIKLTTSGREGYAWLHRHLHLTHDPTPRVTVRLSEGVPA